MLETLNMPDSHVGSTRSLQKSLCTLRSTSILQSASLFSCQWLSQQFCSLKGT